MLKVLGKSENMFTAILYSPEEIEDTKGITGKSPMARRANRNAEKKSGGDNDAALNLAAGAKSPRGPSGAAAAGTAG